MFHLDEFFKIIFIETSQHKIHEAHLKTNLVTYINRMTQHPWWNRIHCKYFYDLRQSQYEKDIANAADMNHLQTDSESWVNTTNTVIWDIAYYIMFSKKEACWDELDRIG